ncbi:hypothetical protein JX265_003626 [Neoarthrinium moseri]|uniref:Uncharacterized protein n=1 Tax=Neoarthrinium moseri TaxID=1658444 RepID=A0A9P9WSI2_9PEZI|nr:hypothetical protein JX265_003626 [Neoarthrinium moseri]
MASTDPPCAKNDPGMEPRNASNGEPTWPKNSRYFIPSIMNVDAALDLIEDDSCFPQDPEPGLPLQCFDLSNNGVFHFQVDTRESSAMTILDPSALGHGSSRVLFLDQRRRYIDESTLVEIAMPVKSWLALLSTCMVPPTALELLHENNGASFQHVSYCGDNPLVPCTAPFEPDKPCAYHICFKLCEWTYEHFVYARYDFHSQTALVVTAGTSNEEQMQQLVAQFYSQGQVTPFAILHSLACVWAREVEQERWELDFAVQKFESSTGVSSLRFHGIKPLPREKLRLRTDMAATQDSLRCTKRASVHTGELFQFLKESLWRFEEVRSQHESHIPSRRHAQQLADALDLRVSQQHNQAAQITDLMARITAQWNVVNAVISHYNNDLNIDMARDSREDSVLMRRIAFVTIVFLPATFMATFFSMGFFQVAGDEGDLSVSRWIWLYVVCTLPLTVLLAWQYAPSRELIRRLSAPWKRWRKVKVADGDVSKA